MPETWPLIRIPNVTAKPKAKLTVRNVPWEPPLSTNCATAPQPNIWAEDGDKALLIDHVYLLSIVKVSSYTLIKLERCS